MTPQAFISKWLNSPIKERAAAQAHFLDMCAMLGEPTPAEVDPSGLDYGFEVGATKTTGGRGFADVFKRGFFALEYKGLGANLDAAFAQLQRYAVALDNPPLLIVSDVGSTIRIHTNWTNSVSKVYEIAIADLGDPEKRAILKAAFSDPEALRPKKTRQEVTEEVATEFAALARSLRARGHAPEKVAHFINRLVFCMFAEDVKLLPEAIFTRMLDRAIEEPAEFETFASGLFKAMKTGGLVGFERIAWFNGGLFDDDLVIALTKDEIKIVKRAALQYWGDIDPSILGTLFERGLDPDKRSQLGAHYTDRDKIMMIINPVIVEPLTVEWETAKARIEEQMAKAAATKGGARTKAIAAAQASLDGYLKRLSDFRVLDPACGSGNFLYLALRSLKDLEHRAQVEAEALGLPRTFPRIGPEVVKGIEINPYAAELARVSVWIGEIQWMLKNGFAAGSNPVLRPLDNIECRDALLTLGEDGQWQEAEWPAADAIVGNPPFLGGKILRSSLGDDAVDRLFAVYRERVSPEADFVSYWFEKARAAIHNEKTFRAGFVSTNSIRSGSSRKTLAKIADEIGLLSAWSDEAWTVEGAAVRVSLVVFGRRQQEEEIKLDGVVVGRLNANLTADGADLTKAERLSENAAIAFQGVTRGAPFEVDEATARAMLSAPQNPNGRRNVEVLVQMKSGGDIVQKRAPRWVVDFTGKALEDARFYERPFAHVLDVVKPLRDGNKRERYRELWWQFSESRSGLRRGIAGLGRFIATPKVSKHRVFVWMYPGEIGDNLTICIARDDDTTFGVLQSRIHEVWALGLGAWIGKGNDPTYTPTTTFETFPFPKGLTPNIPAADYATDPRAIAIAEAAKRLNELRENWLNPADLVRREPEVVAGFPDRIIPVDDAAAKILQKRTLTNLYNERPAWLAHAHAALDKAVADAYGWPADLADDDVLARLFALNQERAN